LGRVALLYDEIYLKHDTGLHPERSVRVKHAYEYLRSKPLFASLIALKPRPATEEEILLVHDKRYFEYLRSLPKTETHALDPDTVFGPGSWEAAVLAAGAVTTAVDSILSGSCDRAFCLVRPPGHHALPGRAMGFCIFNNVAIGAAYAVRACGLERVAIIDFDVHHGNGTQDIFYSDERVLYCSIHKFPFYPGSGSSAESGSGKGRGKTVNVPLPAGSGEAEYIDALSGTILPAVVEHGPSMVLVSAGFDAHEADPIGGMALDDGSFGEITRVIVETARQVCDGKIVSALEGGYNIEALGTSIHAHMTALLGGVPDAG
jgi:acetoin utilization deacetylase AcuC-like enzyme